MPLWSLLAAHGSLAGHRDPFARRWSGVVAALLALTGCRDPSSPLPIDEEPAGHPIAMHAYSACGVGASDELYCWGLLDPPGNDLPPTRWRLSPERLAPAPRLRVVSASAGPPFVCGLTARGEAYCWGTNSSGQVGDSTYAFRATPTAVAGRITFREITVGATHACALARDGSAYCWGSNGFGELGNPSVETHSPAPVTAVAGMRFASISAGRYFTCGIWHDGVAACWGDDTFQALGNGDQPGGPVARPVGSTARFRMVSAGAFHACALDIDGRAYCWGRDEFGVAGVGESGRLARVPERVARDLTFTQLSSGTDYACGLVSSGQAYCWGSGGGGQLGDGAATSTPGPVAVAGGLRLRRIVAGGAITVGIGHDGVAYGWGNNLGGLLGDGTRESKLTPARVASPLLFR